MFKENQKVQYIEDGKIKTGIILKILGDRVVVSSGGILHKLTLDGVTEWEVPVGEDKTVEENKEVAVTILNKALKGKAAREAARKAREAARKANGTKKEEAIVEENK